MNNGLGDIDKNAHLVTGAEAIRQRILLKLSIWKGEWFLDSDVGMPYVDEILGKRGALDLLRRMVKKKVEETPGVIQVTKITVNMSAAYRNASVYVEFDTKFGRLSVDI